MSDKNDKNFNDDIDYLDEEEEVIVLQDEETGEEVEFTLVAMLEDEETHKLYAYLEPVEELEGFEDGDLLINEVAYDDEGNEMFLPIDSDEELDRAFALFDKDYFEQFGVHCDGFSGEDAE